MVKTITTSVEFLLDIACQKLLKSFNVSVSYSKDKSLLFLWNSFIIASRVQAIALASVCESVCHTQQPYQNGASYDHKIFTVGYRRDSSFL